MYLHVNNYKHGDGGPKVWIYTVTLPCVLLARYLIKHRENLTSLIITSNENSLFVINDRFSNPKSVTCLLEFNLQ